MSNENDGKFSPADYAQAHFELNGSEIDDAQRDLFKAYRWDHGDFSVTCEYAPENEESRIFFIVTLNESEFMRCKDESAITSFFSILEQSNSLQERCDDLEAELNKVKSAGFWSKLFS
jgi:hypothetical protein